MQSNCLYSDISPKVCKINFGLLLMKESISEIGKEKKIIHRSSLNFIP